MMLLDSANVWSFLTQVATVCGALGSAVVAAYLALHQRQTNRIETLVNGNLHREQEENKRLRALLEKHGIDHNDG